MAYEKHVFTEKSISKFVSEVTPLSFSLGAKVLIVKDLRMKGISVSIFHEGPKCTKREGQ